MSRDDALRVLARVIDFIAANPPPPPKPGEMSYGSFGNEADARRNHELIRSALAAVRIPYDSDDDREMWHASRLDADQRAVAELLAKHPELPAGSLPMPTPAWAKRKWLGIDPPGPLFSGKPSLFERLREVDADDDDEWLPLLERLSIEDRIMVLTDLALMREDFDTVATQNELIDGITKMPSTLGDWGGRTADMLLGFVGTRWESAEAHPWGVEEIVTEAVLLAIIRAGRPFEAKYDRLLALGNYAYEPRVPVVREIVQAIPEQRREGVVEAALSRLKGPVWRLSIAMRMLETFPYAAIARQALAHIDEGKPRKVMQQLGALAKQHPVIDAVLREHKAGQAPPPKLVVLERTKPTFDELDATGRKQVELCAQLFDGRKVRAAQLIASDEDEDEDEPIAPFERTRIANAKGTPAYDAWRYSVDSGTVFRAGSTDVIAEIIQDGLECSDRALRLALIDALASKPTRAKGDTKAKRTTKPTKTKTKPGRKAKPTAKTTTKPLKAVAKRKRPSKPRRT